MKLAKQFFALLMITFTFSVFGVEKAPTVTLQIFSPFDLPVLLELKQGDKSLAQDVKIDPPKVSATINFPAIYMGTHEYSLFIKKEVDYSISCQVDFLISYDLFQITQAKVKKSTNTHCAYDFISDNGKANFLTLEPID